MQTHREEDSHPGLGLEGRRGGEASAPPEHRAPEGRPAEVPPRGDRRVRDRSGEAGRGDPSNRSSSARRTRAARAADGWRSPAKRGRLAGSRGPGRPVSSRVPKTQSPEISAHLADPAFGTPSPSGFPASAAGKRRESRTPTPGPDRRICRLGDFGVDRAGAATLWRDRTAARTSRRSTSPGGGMCRIPRRRGTGSRLGPTHFPPTQPPPPARAQGTPARSPRASVPDPGRGRGRKTSRSTGPGF